MGRKTPNFREKGVKTDMEISSGNGVKGIWVGVIYAVGNYAEKKMFFQLSDCVLRILGYKYLLS